ncbi:ABC transporter ATP-binding protein [Helicobacter sp. MIT 21-1697]|uniref:metal ABC transporter ATP-binding protein n=1 Tax=Helicobacter sp. MIT 21-1697 TaxID=2993733 RepID=UPI00224B3A0F|nr:ABC transporter ATP-binding protein [Helicobacter sp. MIT 21-1697]MCX2716692.1 ABC transporter ATP-binding protein [Helicobacter sp. MIT 21-1697]
MTPLVDIKELYFAYGEHNVLENVSFKLQEKDFWAIIGPNGGGKTTFIKLILGLLKPQSGKIQFAHNMSIKHIGYVPQITHFNMDFPICVYDVVAMGLFQPKIWGFKPKKIQDIADIMEKLHIAHLAKKPLHSLSGGERQKVLIARAIVNKPQLLILDEPTANVDVKAQEDIYQLLATLNKSLSILVISHDISVTLGYAKEVLYINKYALAHQIPKLNFDLKEHICEVDILTYFAHSSQGKHNE